MPTAATLRSPVLYAEGLRPEALRTMRSHALRMEIEASLAGRFAGALTPAPRTIREVAPTGIPQIDALLAGGLPVGAISELAGPECSGRMSAALAFVAERAREGRVSAWVDAGDAFDPESAAANGVDLSRLLWVRCSESRAAPGFATRAASTPMSGFAYKKSLAPKTVTRIQHGCGGQHPRSEIRGMDTAIGDLLRPKAERNQSTPLSPGAPNRPLESSRHETHSREAQKLGAVPRHEQVSTDRQPKPNRSKYIVEHRASNCESFCPRCAEAAHKPRPEPARILEPAAGAFDHQPRLARPKDVRPWTLLDQALRATDLLLQAGGFSTIVLDLGSIAPEHATRIPLATWFRFRQAADHSRTSLIVLTQTSCAKSSAAMVLRFEPLTVAGTTVMESAQYEATTTRQRFAPVADSGVADSKVADFASPADAFEAAARRKPPQATWQSAMYSRTVVRTVAKPTTEPTTRPATRAATGPAKGAK